MHKRNGGNLNHLRFPDYIVLIFDRLDEPNEMVSASHKERFKISMALKLEETIQMKYTDMSQTKVV